MRSIKYTLIAFVLLLNFQLQGQTAGFSVSGGLGTYDLGPFKSYHDEIISRMPVNVKAGNYFPPYSNIKLNLFRKHSEKIRYGVLYGYSTTGAHANYTDVSGSINFDQTVTAYQLGVNGFYQLYESPLIRLSAFGDIRLSYTRDVINLIVMTEYYFKNDKVNYYAISPFTQIGLEAYIDLKKFSLGFEGGYLYDFGVNMNTSSAETTDSFVDLSPTRKLRSSMSGFRAGIKVILWLYPLEDL